MVNYESLSDAVIKGNVKQAVEATKVAIAEGAEPNDIINKGLKAGITIVGQRFKACEMYVPEVLMAARAMVAGPSWRREWCTVWSPVVISQEDLECELKTF